MRSLNPARIEFWWDVRDGFLLAFLAFCAIIIIACLVAAIIALFSNGLWGSLVLLGLGAAMFLLNFLGKLSNKIRW